MREHGLKDLTAFQRDALAVVAKGGGLYGLAVKERLGEARGEAINHGRLYPNLDSLVHMGLVEKSERNGRTNEYAVTPAGRDAVSDYAEWVAEADQGGEADE